MAFDSDQDKAIAARHDVFKKAAASGTLIAATHLPFPGLVQPLAERAPCPHHRIAHG
jgi:hypothetical protein